MNSLDLLKSDHEKVSALIEQLRQSNDFDEKRDIFDRVEEEIQLHSELEEQIFYPAFRERQGFAELIEEFLDQHAEITDLLDEIDAIEDEVDFDDRIDELQEAFDHHVDEEENELFPMIRRNCTEAELEELGRQMLDSRQAPRAA